MATHRWTVEAAREAGKRSAQLKAERKLNPPIAEPPKPTIELMPVIQPVSNYAIELARAQSELLEELRATPQAKDKAALSQAIKNLREAWHMETGAPKPGTIKPERTSSRARMTARPPEPEPIDPQIPQ